MDREDRYSTLKPETHNSEQDNEDTQAQTVAADAQEPQLRSPLDSEKSDNDSGLMNDSTQDTVDHMRDMESSGRVDMDAYRGEPNHDDNEDKYGRSNKLDPELPADGSGEKSQGSRI